MIVISKIIERFVLTENQGRLLFVRCVWFNGGLQIVKGETIGMMHANIPDNDRFCRDNL
jgi:hypothetical protein